jgi:hypothetical protein
MTILENKRKDLLRDPCSFQAAVLLGKRDAFSKLNPLVSSGTPEDSSHTCRSCFRMGSVDLFDHPSSILLISIAAHWHQQALLPASSSLRTRCEHQPDLNFGRVAF